MRFGSAALSALLLALVACSESGGTREWRPSDHAQPPGVASSPLPGPRAAASPEEARLRAGAALFQSNCATCHGETGRGDGRARSAAVTPTDLTSPSFQSARTDEALMTVIAVGRGAMPGFARELDEAGLVALVAYVRSLGASPTEAAHPGPAPAAP